MLGRKEQKQKQQMERAQDRDYQQEPQEPTPSNKTPTQRERSQFLALASWFAHWNRETKSGIATREDKTYFVMLTPAGQQLAWEVDDEFIRLNQIRKAWSGDFKVTGLEEAERALLGPLEFLLERKLHGPRGDAAEGPKTHRIRS